MKSDSSDREADERRQLVRRTNDQSLVSNKAFFDEILATEGVLILVLDRLGHILAFNRACEQLTGISTRDAVGRFLWEVTNPPDKANETKAFFFRLLKEGLPESHERPWRGADGTDHLIHWNVSEFSTHDEAGTHVFSIGYDITDMRRAEEQLEQRTFQLGERVKELRCLYGISRLSERPQLSLAEYLKQAVELIPPAWQFPGQACASIEYEDQQYSTPGYEFTPMCQQRALVIEGGKVGHVIVCYKQPFPGDSEQPFLEEEERLLDNIAEALGRVITNHRARQRINEYQMRLRSLASDLALTGERERRRIAQQLHDEIGHSLALLKFKLGESRTCGSGAEHEDLMRLLETTIHASRTLTFELSPPVLHELGLGAALEWLCHQLEQNYGIVCQYQDDHQPKSLSEDLRVEVFQAVRELLTNVGKHSRATAALVRTRTAGNILGIEISDDGIGFDPATLSSPGASFGWGLFGIRERLAHLGGQLAINSAPGAGTRIALSVPLVEDEQQAAPPRAAHPELLKATDKPRPIRIILADDQQLTRAGLRSFLERESDMQVIAEAKDGEQAVEQAAQFQPDVVVMDVAMPQMNGIEATRRITSSHPEIKVIGLSMHADGQYVLEMLRAGATGYLLKDCAQDDLAQAIRVVQANLTFLSPGLADSVVKNYVEGRESDDEDSLEELTPRELQVLKLLANGLTTKQIAQQLEVSSKTVETHRQHIMEKLGDNSIAGLTRFAIRRGLVTLEE